jgi:hypothetical protein
LSKYGLGTIKIVTFSEAKLKKVSGALREGLGMAGGTATVIADQMGEERDD